MAHIPDRLWGGSLISKLAEDGDGRGTDNRYYTGVSAGVLLLHAIRSERNKAQRRMEIHTERNQTGLER